MTFYFDLAISINEDEISAMGNHFFSFTQLVIINSLCKSTAYEMGSQIITHRKDKHIAVFF